MTKEEFRKDHSTKHSDWCPYKSTAKVARGRKHPVPVFRDSPGRPPLAANAISPALAKTVRGALLSVYERMGGDDALYNWAIAHETEFYKLIIKAVPKESEVNNRAAGLTVVIGKMPDAEAPTVSVGKTITVEPQDKP